MTCLKEGEVRKEGRKEALGTPNLLYVAYLVKLYQIPPESTKKLQNHRLTSNELQVLVYIYINILFLYKLLVLIEVPGNMFWQDLLTPDNQGHCT